MEEIKRPSSKEFKQKVLKGNSGWWGQLPNKYSMVVQILRDSACSGMCSQFGHDKVAFKKKDLFTIILKGFGRQ